MKLSEDLPTVRSSHDSQIWIYGSGNELTKRPKKVGIVSTEEHCHPHTQALRKMGFKVVKLGGNPSTIPRSLHFVILRHESCSHTASDAALAWVRRSPKTRILAIANSLTRIRQAAQGYLDDFPLDQPAADAIDAAREAERLRKTPKPPPKRKTRKRPHDFKPTEKPMQPATETYLPGQLQEQLAEYNAAAQTIYRMIEAKQSIGCGIEDLRKQWKRDFGHEKSKSTVATILVKLKKNGFIRNIGAEGRVSSGRQKAGWYVASVFHSEMKGPVLRAYNAYCKRISKKPAPKKAQPQLATPTPQAKARSGFSPKKSPPGGNNGLGEGTLGAVPLPAPPPPPAPSDAYGSILEEAELLVMWMRDWNVDSITLSRTGEVEVSNEPTHSPKLEVRFTTATKK